MAGGLVGGSALDEELRKSCVVRLRGLPFSATENDIREFFNGLDMVPEGVVIQLNFQGRSTGQAYVQFTNAEHANKALERNKQHIGSRYIEVYKGHLADMEAALRMVGRGSGSGLTGGAGGGGAAGTGIPGMGGSSDMRYAGVLRMRGMPYSCTVADIAAFFKGLSIVPDGIFIITHPDGRPTGEAFVEFTDEETAARAMQLHREPMGSRYVELFRSTKGEMMAAVQHRMYGMFGGPGGGGGHGMMGPPGGFMGPGGMMGGFGMPGMGAASLAAMQQQQQQHNMFNPNLNPASAAVNNLAGLPLGAAAAQAAAAANASASDNVCLKMRGLPFHAGVQDILEFFRGYAVVDNGVHVVTGPGDRPTGDAFVEFASVEEAGRAMERHRQHIGSRYIELLRVTKSEALLSLQGSMAPFNMAAAMDPNMQLLLLQQQQLQAAAALGMGGGGGLPGTAAGGWGGMGMGMGMGMNAGMGGMNLGMGGTAPAAAGGGGGLGGDMQGLYQQQQQQQQPPQQAAAAPAAAGGPGNGGAGGMGFGQFYHA